MTDLAGHGGYVSAGTIDARGVATAAPSAAAAHRLDIDGMRALAIMPVLFFHLGSTLLKGGYIGVDVFFVISGYLITGILQSELSAQKFSILNFYDRRIRRIFPALFAVFIASTIAAFLLLFPPEILDFSKSGMAAALFSSNFYFMSATDYFNVAAESNPLLHTWSLAVEEQYYIVFPLLLWLLRGADRRWTILVVAGLALASFALSVVFVRSHQVAAFYMAPTRAWELLIGALLALGAVPKLNRTWLREAAAALGIALIVAGCFLFYRNMLFPGERALVPCLGAALLLHAGASGPTLVSRILSLRPLVFIGLISYSLYLWHWPIIIFFQIWSAQPIGPGEGALLLLASFAAAVLSWRYIERPFQRKTIAASPLALRLSAVGGMIGMLAVWLGLTASGGLANAFPGEVARLASYIHYDDQAVYRRGTCFLDSHANALSDFDAASCLARAPGKPNILLVGDSHAAHLWRGLADELPATSVLQATASGCKPVFGGRGHPTCLALMNEALDGETGKGSLDAVILSARWEAEDIPLLVATVDRLAARVPLIYVSGPIVEYREALPRILARAALDKEPGLLVSERSDEPGQIDARIRAALAGHRGVVYLSPFKSLCAQPSLACRTTTDGGIPVQWDYGHLTEGGAEFLVKTWRDEGLLAFR
jgi:peptidoglycan/LPS O-acetylase OafA/YrhL